MDLKKELILYVVFGVLTTVVNIIAYVVFAKFLNVDYIISNIIAWFLSVLFAYITNRIWVFESKSDNILREISLFFGGRLFSGVVDTSLLYLMVDILLVGDFVSKVVTQIIVVVLNYVISKLVVFK
ncbi:MAG: GtrA family protein [Methanosphaera sp.]|nr:GtrA family protein [Methanosphaera sp.]